MYTVKGYIVENYWMAMDENRLNDDYCEGKV